MRSSLCTALVALALGLHACTPEAKQATEVLLEIDAEPLVKAQTKRLKVDIQGGASTDKIADYTRDDAPPLKDPKFPLRVGLVPLNGDARRSYSVTLTAYDETGAFLAQTRLISGYIRGALRYARLVLEDDCLQNDACGGTAAMPLTCRRGQCVDPHVDAGLLSADRSKPTAVNELPGTVQASDAEQAPDGASADAADTMGGAAPDVSDAGDAGPLQPGMAGYDAAAVSPSMDDAGLKSDVCRLGASTLPCKLGS